MSQRLVLKQQTSLRNRIHLAIVGVTTGVFVASAMFLANHFANTHNSVAGNATVITTNVLPLMPLDVSDEMNINSNFPQVSIALRNDSVSLTLISTNTTVIDGAEIKIYDEAKAKSQPIVLTIPQRLNRKSYTVSIPKNMLAEKTRIETRANIVSAKKSEVISTDDYKWINVFSYNKKSNLAMAIPLNVKSENVQDKSATISWSGVNNAIKYIVRTRPVGTTEWKRGVVSAPGNKRYLVNLEPKTEYEVEVQSVIYAGHIDTSGFSAPIRFSTTERRTGEN